MKIVAITPNNKRDYTTELTIDGLKQLGVELHCSSIGNGIAEQESDHELITHAKDADAIVAFFGKIRGNMPPKHYLLNVFDAKEKSIYVDGSEWTYTAYPNPGQVAASRVDHTFRRGEPWLNASMLNTCAAYLKRECYKVDLDRGIIPFPFGLPTFLDIFNEKVEKDIDVMCCFGQISDGLRSQAVDVCNEIRRKRPGLKIVTGQFRHDTYIEILKRSRIVIDAWGGGDNCLRFWEAIGAGACCVYQRYNVVFPNPFVDMHDAVGYSSGDELKRSLLVLLDDRRLTMKIASEGRRHAKYFHTSKERAKTLLNSIAIKLP